MTILDISKPKLYYKSMFIFDLLFINSVLVCLKATILQGMKHRLYKKVNIQIATLKTLNKHLALLNK